MHIFGSDAYFYNTACHIININKTPDILYYYLLRSRGLYARMCLPYVFIVLLLCCMHACAYTACGF